jgi:hypothetical protein
MENLPPDSFGKLFHDFPRLNVEEILIKYNYKNHNQKE